MTRRFDRGVSLLYVTGFIVVSLLLMFGMIETQLRAHVQVGHAMKRAQAEWIAEAGVAFARVHIRDLQGGRTVERLCGKGKFRVVLEDGTGTGTIRITAMVPPREDAATVVECVLMVSELDKVRFPGSAGILPANRPEAAKMAALPGK